MIPEKALTKVVPVELPINAESSRAIEPLPELGEASPPVLKNALAEPM